MTLIVVTSLGSSTTATGAASAASVAGASSGVSFAREGVLEMEEALETREGVLEIVSAAALFSSSLTAAGSFSAATGGETAGASHCSSFSDTTREGALEREDVLEVMGDVSTLVTAAAFFSSSLTVAGSSSSTTGDVTEGASRCSSSSATATDGALESEDALETREGVLETVSATGLFSSTLSDFDKAARANNSWATLQMGSEGSVDAASRCSANEGVSVIILRGLRASTAEGLSRVVSVHCSTSPRLIVSIASSTMVNIA